MRYLGSTFTGVALLLAGCGGGDSGPATAAQAPTDAVPPAPAPTVTAPPEALEVALAHPDGPTANGRALVWREGERTRVLVTLTAPGDGPFPAALREGTCDDFERHPPLLLSNVRAGASDSSVDISFAELEEEPHSVVVLSGLEAPAIISCGTIAGADER